MIASHDPSAFPVVLHDELDGKSSEKAFLLRAIFVRDVVKNCEVLMSAVLRPTTTPHAPNVAWRYPSALLLSHLLSSNDAVNFLESAAAGELKVTEVEVTFDRPQGCRITRVPVENYWMEQAGNVYDMCIHQQVNVPQQDELIALGAPYYPDAYAGARDWLGLREYHGSSDSSHGHLLVLMPETRAYVAGAQWDGDELSLRVDGTLTQEPGFSVIGAYWIGKQIYQLAAPVVQGQAQLQVPVGADRLDLHVVGMHGEVLDSHKDDVNNMSRGLRILGKRAERVAQPTDLAEIYAGEGVRTEFKSYLELSDEKMPNAEKDKLSEVLRTVAAFANTEGGTIYFGVSDAIEIVGTEQAVAKWAKRPGDDTASIESYMGALRSRVHDVMYPGVSLRTRSMNHQGKLIIALDVDKSPRPVCMNNDRMTYTRVSSNNVKTAAADLPPATSSPFQ